jgi:hypothetical protein
MPQFQQPPPHYVPGVPKPWLSATAYQDLTRDGVPSLDHALAYTPFRDCASENRPAPHGVLRIENVRDLSPSL